MSDESVKIMSLLDELEELITTSSKVPFSEKGVIDVDMAQRIIEDIRLGLPRDIKEAAWVKQEKDRIINDAKDEYNKLIVTAKDEAEYLVDSDLIKREAQKRAASILTEAESHASYIKLKTYEYIDKLLFDVQTEISSITATFFEPMTEKVSETISNVNSKINKNREEMKNLADKVNFTVDDSSYSSDENDEKDY